MSLPWLRLSEARKVWIKTSQSSFAMLDHKLAATQTPEEVDVHHQASSRLATAPACLTFDQLFLPSQNHLEISSPMDYLNLYLHYTPNPPPGQHFSPSGSCDNVNENSKNRTVSSSMHMFDISYKQNGKMWPLWVWCMVHFWSFFTKSHLELRSGKWGKLFCCWKQRL